MRKQLEDPQLQADITQAIDGIQNTLDAANEAIHKEHLAAAVVDLSERVDDWKSLKMDAFGDLLRFGTFAVVKGDSGKDSEREVCINLTILERSEEPSTDRSPSPVPHFPLRAHPLMLQRYQPKQAEDQAYDE